MTKSILDQLDEAEKACIESSRKLGTDEFDVLQHNQLCDYFESLCRQNIRALIDIAKAAKAAMDASKKPIGLLSWVGEEANAYYQLEEALAKLNEGGETK